MNFVEENDVVLIKLNNGEDFVIKIVKDGFLSVPFGTVFFNDLIGKEYGDVINFRGKNRRGYILKNSIVDYIFNLKRKTQVVYPKDIGYSILYLDLRPGDSVLECGTGSGAATAVLSRAVGKEGRVITYDLDPENSKIAKENLTFIPFYNNVLFKMGDVKDGLKERDMDAFFLDVPDPENSVENAINTLKPSGKICIIAPTFNQVQKVLEKMEKMKNTIDIQVWETMIRNYKINPERLRPEDKMVGHTTFMIFGTKVVWR